MIAIKDMEIPKHCMTCEFHDQMYNRCNIGHFETGAKFIKGNNKWYFKHPNCPLVEIVTCKDCKHCCHITDTPKVLLCEKHNCQQVSKNFYCADGERREQNV